MSKGRILLVDDEKDFAVVIGMALESRGYVVDVVYCGRDAVKMLKNRDYAPDLVLLDVRLPDASGVKLVPIVKRFNPKAAIIMVSAVGSTSTVVSAIKFGASDYIQKPFEQAELFGKVERIIEMIQIKKQKANLNEIDQRMRLIGTSQSVQRLMNEITRIQNSDATVLLRGESGTGKSMVAEIIHNLSPRRMHPFVTVTCSAMPETLIESELFGHERGAFTGAVASKIGKFELADQGTVFLDEIGDLTPDVQIKLLRFLQGYEFERVGGLQTLRSNVRVIAATNQNLERAMETQRFREDLYYRINVYPIIMPALRDRLEDFPALINFFLGVFSRRERKKFNPVSEAVIQELIKYPWPGNIRELQNVVSRAVILGQEPDLKLSDFLTHHIERKPSPDQHSLEAIRGSSSNPPKSSQKSPEARSSDAPKAGPPPEKAASVLDLEYERLVDALKGANGNVSEAAKALDISRDTVYRRMKKYGLTPKKQSA